VVGSCVKGQCLTDQSWITDQPMAVYAEMWKLLHKEDALEEREMLMCRVLLNVSVRGVWVCVLC
jgi:hypothetical protein